MIRTLATIAALSFILAIACLASAFAIAGGPFSIDDNWRFHRDTTPISGERFVPGDTVARVDPV